MDINLQHRYMTMVYDTTLPIVYELLFMQIASSVCDMDINVELQNQQETQNIDNYSKQSQHLRTNNALRFCTRWSLSEIQKNHYNKKKRSMFRIAILFVVLTFSVMDFE